MALPLRLEANRALLQDSLLPFLYRTRTLLPYRSSSAKSNVPNLSRPITTTERWAKPLHDGRHRGHGDATANPKVYSRSKSPRQLPQRDPGGRSHSVPFEGDLLSKLEGSTITPKEFFKFETLMRKKARTSGMNAQGREKNRKSPSEVDVAKPLFPKPLQALAEEAEKLRSNSRDGVVSTNAAVSAIAGDYFTTVKDRMDRASSDVALWKILQHDVLNRVVALQDRLATRQSQQAHGIDRTREITQSMPGLLIHFMKLIQSVFHGSPFGLMLLPTLKKMGPTAFALTVSTELYNQHMHILYRQYSDIDAIVQALSEMDQEVYEFDQGTKDLLESILNHAHTSRRGQNGAGQQALWLTDRKTRSLSKLERWNQTVDMRVSSAAMRKARDTSIDYENN